MMQATTRHERDYDKSVLNAEKNKTLEPETGGDQEAEPRSEPEHEHELKSKQGPMRMCIVTREEHPKLDLLRFVAGPDGAVVVDLSGKLPGRGFYTLPDRQTLELAIRKRAFARGAKGQVTVPEGFADHVETLKKQHTLQRMGLMRRNGALKIGFTKVSDLIDKGRAGLYLYPLDASSPDCGKFVRRLGPQTPCFQLFDSKELGQALGRDHLMHVAATQGRQCQALVKALTVVQHLSSDSRSHPE